MRSLNFDIGLVQGRLFASVVMNDVLKSREKTPEFIERLKSAEMQDTNSEEYSLRFHVGIRSNMKCFSSALRISSIVLSTLITSNSVKMHPGD